MAVHLRGGKTTRQFDLIKAARQFDANFTRKEWKNDPLIALQLQKFDTVGNEIGDCFVSDKVLFVARSKRIVRTTQTNRKLTAE